MKMLMKSRMLKQVSFAALMLAAMVSQAQTLKVIHAFSGKTDGGTPNGSLIFDSAGNFYGVTAAGGTSTECTDGCGVVFEFSPTASGGWRESPLFSFAPINGDFPAGNLLLSSSGHLIGTTPTGSYTQGVIYELARSKDVWDQTLLYLFNGPGDGSGPNDGLIADSAGHLYATALQGGDDSVCSGFGCGTVFELTPTTTGFWLETTLHEFTGAPDGLTPVANLISDADGNLYGTAPYGGNLTGTCVATGCGVVFELSRNSSGTWTETILYSFSGPDGASPFGSLAMDASGNLYGTTFWGGQYCPSAGCGIVFKLTPNADGTWQETKLHQFRFTDGDGLDSGVVLDSTGNVYGTTTAGGNTTACGGAGCGVIFKLAPTASGPWTFTRLHTFSGGNDGAESSAPAINMPLTFGPDGNLYGVAPAGGAHGAGVVFSIAP